MQILMTIGYFAVMLGLMILIFILGKKYIFSKVKINKWIPLTIAVILFLIQMFIKVPRDNSAQMILSILYTLVPVFFFAWFLDIQTTGGPRKQDKKITIRPKAKPNRAKHMQTQKK